MITIFKIFENITQPKFEKGDIVYNIGSPAPIKCVVVEVIPQSEHPENKFNRYMLDRYPNLSVREDKLISEYEFDAKKYNL